MAEVKQAFSVIKLLCTERPTDRYLSAEAELVGSGNQEVLLVSMIEIANRWQTAIDLGNAIRAEFVKSYRSSSQRSVLTKFETTLKNINHLLDDNETKVAEPIHCVLAIFSDNQLYFSAINNGHLLLFRRGKLTQITGLHLAGERFASVTSGDLKKDDWLIAGSLEVRSLLKSSNPADWQAADKVALIQELCREVNPAGYDQLAAVAMEVSAEPHTETIKLVPTNASKSRVFSPTVILSKILYQLKRVGSGMAALWRRKQPTAHEKAEEVENEPVVATTPTRRRFPYRTLIAGVIVVALLATGLVIIRNEFHKVSKKPVVEIPTIDTLLSQTSNDGLFAFIEQNLTVDNYNALTPAQKSHFTTNLQSRGVTLIPPTSLVATADAPLVTLDNTAKYLYGADNSGQLWRFDTNLSKFSQAGVIQNPISLTAMTDNKIVVSDQAGQLWLSDGSTAAPQSLPLPAALTQGVKLVQKFGSSNLYLYQTATNSVYKVGGFIRDIFPASQVPPAPGAEPPPPPDPTITSSILNFGTLADWTVPGDFIGASADGVIKSFTKNKLENLSIQYYQDNAPIHLSLTGKDNEVAVARGKFVTLFSTSDGHKISEQAIVTDQLITDLSPGPNDNLYVAAGKVLYKIR